MVKKKTTAAKRSSRPVKVAPAARGERPAPARKAAMQAKHGFRGYDFISLVDLKTFQAEVLDGVTGPAYANIYRQPLHRQALLQARERGIYHYEWSGTQDGQSVWFQSTCVALAQPDGKVGGVLVLARDLSHWGLATRPESGLKEWTAPLTFSQILLAARESEKKEISKALHDEVGSSAVILTALLSLVKANVVKGKNAQALRDIAQLDQQIKEMMGRLRNIIVSLRPPILDNQGGLGGAVRELLENISLLSHLPYQFDYDAGDESLCLCDNVKILLYRVVQEALTNIIKHARAKQIRVVLKVSGMQVRLQVKDDGIGFNPKQPVSMQHVGLLAMKDSVELLGGKITVKSAPGKGTCIEVVCPCIVYGGKKV